MSGKLKITPGKWAARRVPTYETTEPGRVRITGQDPNRWHITATYDTPEDPVIARTMTHIAHVERCGDMSDEELEANAVAIAALPELLKSIQALGAMPEGYCFCFGHERDPSKPEHLHTGECRDLRSALNAVQGGEA